MRCWRKSEPAGNGFEEFQETVGIGCKNHHQRGDKDKAPFFEFGDTAIGFAYLLVNRFEFFVDAVEALLAAGGKVFCSRPKNYGGNYGFWSSKSILFQKISLTLANAEIYANVLIAR